MNLSAAKQGLATALGTATGLSGKTFAYEPGQVTPPSAWVTNAAIDYRVEMGESWTMRASLRVTVVVNSGQSEKAQQELDSYLATEGTKSIPLALFANRTLSGAVDYVDTIGVEDAGLIEVGGQLYVGAHLLVEVVG